LGIDCTLKVILLHTFAKEVLKSKICCKAVLSKRQIRTISFISHEKKEIERQFRDRVLGPKQNLLVVINPFGGTGTAMRNWRLCEPLFKMAESRVAYKILET